jgi:hypothetical protein
MQISKFQKLDVDILLEWIYDDSNYIAEDYRIIVDTLTESRSFSQNEMTGVVDSITNNTTDKQLFILDKTTNKWGIIDPNPLSNRYHFLQYQNYSGNVPFRYDKVRIHFPVNYDFKDKLGLLLNIELFNKLQDKMFSICNYFFDKTDPNRVLEFNFGTPFQFQERIWGKYLEILLPSPYALTKDYQIIDTLVKPKDGSIHKNLVSEDYNILSLETPIFVSFHFLTKREEKLKQVSYLTTEPFQITLPLVPEFENLGVKIEHASDGDYFEIFGTFNNTISDFNAFLKNSEKEGKRYYIIYEITQFEKNIKTKTLSFFKDDNFDIPEEFRPIIKFSTTTASIDVTMKVINSSDDSIILRKTQYTMLQDEASRYSKKLTKINIKDTYKPKVYNAKASEIVIEGFSVLPQAEKVQVPYPVMFERYNIVSANQSEQINDTTYYGNGLNQILLHHTDNVVELKIAKGTNSDGFVPFTILEGTPVFLQFKSNKKVVEVPLFQESGRVNLPEGNVVFRVPSSQMPIISEIKKDGFDQFYILLKPTSGIVTVVYFGRFIISNEF